MSFIGTVYLIHLDRPFISGNSAPVKHYLGFALNTSTRLYHHKKGTGSKMLAAVNAAGIEYEIVREFKKVTRDFERNLHKQHNAARYCPVCSENPRTPRGYSEPVKIEKRKYKLAPGADGMQTVEFTRLATTAELFKKLARRFRVGEKFKFQNKVFTRIFKKKNGHHFELESAARVGFIKCLDESIPFGEKEFEAARALYGGELERHRIGKFAVIQTELHKDNIFQDIPF